MTTSHRRRSLRYPQRSIAACFAARGHKMRKKEVKYKETEGMKGQQDKHEGGGVVRAQAAGERAGED